MTATLGRKSQEMRPGHREATRGGRRFQHFWSLQQRFPRLLSFSGPSFQPGSRKPVPPEESVNEQAGGPGGGLADSQLCSISTSLIMHPGHLQMTGPHPFLYHFSSPSTHGSREHTPRLEAATPALQRPVNGDQESLTIAALPRVNAS